MIQMFCARTLEIDEPELALEELLSQIDIGGLLSNSVGIISCNHEFVSNGTTKYLSDNLPFEVIGLTTMVTMVNGEYDQYSLGLTVLTSDEVSFKTTATVDLNTENYRDEIDKACATYVNNSDERPSFILTVFPYSTEISGSMMISQVDKSCDGIPVWGTVASDDTMSFENSKTIHNGIGSLASLVMIFMYGPLKASFIVEALPDRNISTRKAVITSSDGYRIYTVNGVTPKEYFEELGIELSDGPDALAVPVMIDYEDGSKPIASAFFKIYPDGSGLTGIEAPQDTTFSLGEIDYDGIIETAGESVEKALNVENATGMLMFPCVTRYMMSSPLCDDEMCLVSEKINAKFPYMLAYSGGEICPVPGTDDRLSNRYHNYTFIACVFS